MSVRQRLSHWVGWLADRKIPRALRAPLYRGYARATGANLDEVRLELAELPSLSHFFVRHLKAGARPFPTDPAAFPSPVDGTVQAITPIERGTTLQAKGRPYAVDELMGDAGRGLDLDGGLAWTLYLSPRDYHRIHAPDDLALEHVHWLDGDRSPVRSSVLARRDRVLAGNERAALRVRSAHGAYALVFVGALNVGRIRVVGVEPGRSGDVDPAPTFERGDELGRFELGSTVVILTPPGGPRPIDGLEHGRRLRMGETIGRR